MDLNSDLAEGFGRWELTDDVALLGIATSANAACGFHAGDPSVMRRACAQAADRGVVVGAQVGYRDLAGFGRRFIDVAPDDLTNDVIYQIGALDGFARVAGTRVRYVKPHGALYHATVHHPEQASAVVQAVRDYDPELGILGLPGSTLLDLAEEAGLHTYREAFAERAYTPEGTLVPRGEPGAMLHDADYVAERCVRIARGEPIETIDGSYITVEADSICVHGDSPDAVATAAAVRDKFHEAGIELRSFVSAGG